MDTRRPTVRFCIAGTQAEYKGQREAAKSLYEQAWEAAKDDMDRCIAAHYVARFQESPEARLHWNQKALDFAKTADDDQVKDFYPSLYLNMGQSYEALGNEAEARHYYDLAAALDAPHQAFSNQ